MQAANRTRILLFLVGLIFVPAATILVIFFARGYRPDFTTGQIQPTGLLVAHSYPDGAQVYLNGQVKSATNTTLNLPPGPYLIEIKKDGFRSWKKNLLVETEIVTRATAVLFPSVPILKAITTTGASLPTLSPDGTKVAFLRPGVNQTQVFILDITESPLGLINRESKLIATLPSSLQPLASSFQLTWSPDSRQILAILNQSTAYLLTPDSQQSPLQIANSAVVLNSWTQSQKIREAEKFAALPLPLQNIFASASAQLLWSPRENRILYTATASATLPDHIKKPLPGSSTQTQWRRLTPGEVYIYDLEEDRNFRIDEIKPQASSLNAGWSWFPTSSHLLRVEGQQINIIEYDGQNPTLVYPGPLAEPIAIPYPSAKQLLILTDLSPTVYPSGAPSSPRGEGGPNLYAVSLR